jgi:aspartate/methionine/tyrosine aminotransferase
VAEYLDDMPQFDFVKPDGGLCVLLRFRDGRDAQPFVDKLLNECRVIVFPGAFFEVNDGFRLSFGIDSERLHVALKSIQKQLEG